jgi:hypothetical protein
MGLINYIKGNRYGKEANQLERESMEDAFLQEAMDGYDAVISNHLNSLERLEEKVREQSTKKKKQHTLILYLSVAASIALIISVGSIFFFNSPKEDLIAKRTENIQQSNRPVSEKLQKKVATDVNIPVEEVVAKEQELTKLKESEVIANKKSEVDNRSLKQVSDRSMAMEESRDEMNDVVVGGYGSSKKKDMLSSVSSANAAEAMQGRVAGMQVTATEGSPDADVKVRVRGGSSITQSNQVLDENKEAPKPKEFGKRQFKAFFLSKVKKNVCGETKASVEVAFTLNADQYPSSFRIPKSSCDEAKSEVIRILSYSPRWTEKAGEQLRMKLEW